MSDSVSDLPSLLCTLEPILNEGVYVYSIVTTDAERVSVSPLATFQEKEGTTIIILESEALRAGLPILFRAAWITLKVHSDLNAVGLTAAFSHVLSKAGISCNVVAGVYHDHLFVPIDRASEAITQLRTLQKEGKP